MIHCHFRTDCKYLWIYADIHLTEKFLAHTLAKLRIPFIGNKTVAARIIFRLRLLLYGFCFFCTCNFPNLDLVFKNSFNSITQLLIEILRIAHNLQHFFRTVCCVIETSIPNRDRAAHVITLQCGISCFLVNGNRVLPYRGIFLLFFLLLYFLLWRFCKLHITVINLRQIGQG